MTVPRSRAWTAPPPDALRDAGLNPMFTPEHSDTVPDEHVISSVPAAGTEVEPGLLRGGEGVRGTGER
ncbi:PASTA domain-containing protein [Kocuria rhizophila]|nr:PASTA domain-containing protein [Kocuria rhizophila]